MCVHCDEEAEAMRPVVDALIAGECQQRKLFPKRTENQHAARLANVIIDVYTEDDNHFTTENFRALVMSYSIVVQRLIALQEATGLA